MHVLFINNISSISSCKSHTVKCRYHMNVFIIPSIKIHLCTKISFKIVFWKLKFLSAITAFSVIELTNSEKVKQFTTLLFTYAEFHHVVKMWFFFLL